MPTIRANLLWSRSNFNNPVMVAWGNIISGPPDLVVAAGNIINLFAPGANTGYIPASAIDAGARVFGIAAGLSTGPPQDIVAGLEDRVVIFGIREGTLARLFETEPETGALFNDLAIADIDGDGREEVIAASAGNQALYIYRQSQETPEIRLELLAIRILPGPSQKVAVLERGAGNLPLIVTAYKNNSASGLLTLFFTERGFAGGPADPNLPVSVTSLTAGELEGQGVQEIAWGGGDGAVRVVGVNSRLNNILVTNNLGNSVPALTAGMITGKNRDTLIAGTPGAILFGFTAPVASASPDWTVGVGGPVSDLALSSEGLLGVGTTNGVAQVWLLTDPGNSTHVVRPGDTLYNLALLYGTTATAIAGLNGLPDTGMIYPGQTLIIP